MSESIKYGFDPSAGFFCLDLDRKIGVYSYPDSQNSIIAAQYADDEERLMRLVRMILKSEENLRENVGRDSYDKHYSSFHACLLKATNALLREEAEKART